MADHCCVQVLDIQESLGISRSIPIAIKGEAHDIHVDIKFPQDNFAGVDFGPLRVLDDSVKQLVLRNTEKYEVKFAFAIRNDQVLRLVTISPENGVLPPNKDTTIMVSLHARYHHVLPHVDMTQLGFCGMWVFELGA